MPTPLQLLNHRIEHYKKLLKEAKTIEARSFLRREIYNAKVVLRENY